MALQSLEGNPQLSFVTRMEDWTCLGQHKRQPEFPVVTRESRPNSRKTTWLPRHRKMKPFPATASQEKSLTERLHFRFSLSCIGEGNGNPLQCSCLENPRDGEAWWAAIYGVTQSRIRLKRLSNSAALAEKAMAPHSSTLAWKIPWMEEPGGLQSMGSLRVGHD